MKWATSTTERHLPRSGEALDAHINDYHSWRGLVMKMKPEARLGCLIKILEPTLEEVLGSQQAEG